MGTGFECEIIESQEGIIPRAVRHLFAAINNLKENPYDENGVCMEMLQFSVGAQFMELYNEEIIDLLDPYNKVCSQPTKDCTACIADGAHLLACSELFDVIGVSILVWKLMYCVSGTFTLFRNSQAFGTSNFDTDSHAHFNFWHNFLFSLFLSFPMLRSHLDKNL